MDSQDQVLQKLTLIDRDLRSLRYTFGIVLIIVTVLLAFAAPTLVKLISGSVSRGTSPAVMSPGVYKGVPAPTPPAAGGATTTAH